MQGNGNGLTCLNRRGLQIFILHVQLEIVIALGNLGGADHVDFKIVVAFGLNIRDEERGRPVFGKEGYAAILPDLIRAEGHLDVLDGGKA